jgi:hypothetical protein
MNKERDPSILYNLSGQFTHTLHYFKLGHLPRSGIRKLNICKHQDGDIPNTGIRLILLDHGSMVDERDPSICLNLSCHFAHELHYFEVGITPKRH